MLRIANYLHSTHTISNLAPCQNISYTNASADCLRHLKKGLLYLSAVILLHVNITQIVCEYTMHICIKKKKNPKKPPPPESIP